VNDAVSFSGSRGGQQLELLNNWQMTVIPSLATQIPYQLHDVMVAKVADRASDVHEDFCNSEHKCPAIRTLYRMQY
jgi:hypothetical protein